MQYVLLTTGLGFRSQTHVAQNHPSFQFQGILTSLLTSTGTWYDVVYKHTFRKKNPHKCKQNEINLKMSVVKAYNFLK